MLTVKVLIHSSMFQIFKMQYSSNTPLNTETCPFAMKTWLSISSWRFIQWQTTDFCNLDYQIRLISHLQWSGDQKMFMYSVSEAIPSRMWIGYFCFIRTNYAGVPNSTNTCYAILLKMFLDYRSRFLKSVWHRLSETDLLQVRL